MLTNHEIKDIATAATASPGEKLGILIPIMYNTRLNAG
jgi:hypothetical protein